TTFDRDLHVKADRARLSRIFTTLCERVADDLRRKGVAGRTIGIKLRCADFSTVSRAARCGRAGAGAPKRAVR
ncbi:MAG: DNA polymerase IV, partial [Betaproteobacteria bacterium]